MRFGNLSRCRGTSVTYAPMSPRTRKDLTKASRSSSGGASSAMKASIAWPSGVASEAAITHSSGSGEVSSLVPSAASQPRWPEVA